MSWSLFLTPIASFAGAWLAAQLALRSFYKQKVWERKVTAYAAIFEALHHMNQWFDKEQTAIERSNDLPADEEKELRKQYGIAQADLQKVLDREVWLIPDGCRTRLDSMFKDLQKGGFDGWYELIDHGNGVTREAIDDLRGMVRADLDLDGSAMRKAIAQCLKLSFKNPSAKEPPKLKPFI